jgi:hypothetical protein
MPGTSDTQLGEALLKFVQSDAYPETEEIISSKLPSSALPVVVDILHKARQDVKVHLRKLRPCASCWLTSFHGRSTFELRAVMCYPTWKIGLLKRGG